MKVIEAPDKPDRGGCDPQIQEEPVEMPDETPVPVEIPELIPAPDIFVPAEAE
ncbi:MAG TPA: hypothetical protein PKD55_01395 [Bellilinea sp.]|nr:hypothetical protein [Bellilinea sp.]